MAYVYTTFDRILSVVYFFKGVVVSDNVIREIGNGEHILFVDDEPLITALICGFIKSIGYKITLATSGDEALCLFKENGNQFDCVITDYSMDGMSGITLISKIRLLNYDIPIIIYSGYGELLDVVMKTDLPNIYALMKPCSLAKLSVLIKEVLKK